MDSNTKRMILAELDRLDEQQERRLLTFVRQLAAPSGTPGENLVGFAECVEAPDLRRMAEAIESGCEVIDPNAW